MEELREALGESEVFLQFQEQLSRVAALERTVLLIGERGSGKELAAGSLHYLSRRWEKPLVSLNCATFHANLLEAELFGHARGAFTGATQERKGLFEEAHQGTLFLDEIALIPLAAQEKILRVVEYGEYRRLGSSEYQKADVRLIGATSADLPTLVAQGQFKADLLDRLAFEVLYIPPLRLRSKDILLLARHFALAFNEENHLFETLNFTEQAEQALCQYSWPGNIRELKNVVERSVYKSPGPLIQNWFFQPFQNPFQNLCQNSSQDPSVEAPETSAEVPEESTFSNGSAIPLARYKDTLRQTERDFLLRALQETRFKQKEAAKLLNISYDQFRALYRKYRDVL